MTTPTRSHAPHTARDRRLRAARRLLDGLGRASFVAYRHDPTSDVDVLAHGLTPDGRVAVVCTAATLTEAFGEEVVGDTHAVRLDLHREAASPEVRIIVASAHLLGEVEAVFGFWALVLVLAIFAADGSAAAVRYLQGRDFTEPMFVFAIMVIAASRPVLHFAGIIVRLAAAALPVDRALATTFVSLSVVPLLGSFITEPAAMTLAALARPGLV